MPWWHIGSGCIGPPFLTSTLDGGEWSASRLGVFTPGEFGPITDGQEALWASEPVWTLRGREKLALAEIRTPDIQLVAILVNINQIMTRRVMCRFSFNFTTFLYLVNFGIILTFILRLQHNMPYITFILILKLIWWPSYLERYKSWNDWEIKIECNCLLKTTID
jgi:hypothetical protein